MTGNCPVCGADVAASPSSAYEGLIKLAPHDNHLVRGCLVAPPCIGSGCTERPLEPGEAAA